MRVMKHPLNESPGFCIFLFFFPFMVCMLKPENNMHETVLYSVGPRIRVRWMAGKESTFTH